MFTVGRILMVAGETSKYTVVVGIGVAITALVPFSLVLSAEDRKIHIIMVPVSRCPLTLSMAYHTIGREACGNVVGTVGCIVCSGMTSITGVGRIVVVAIVT